jgi:hypothetical protein
VRDLDHANMITACVSVLGRHYASMPEEIELIALSASAKHSKL